MLDGLGVVAGAERSFLSVVDGPPSAERTRVRLPVLEPSDDAPLTPEDEAAIASRPTTRGECAAVPRPCPFVACRYHLFGDVDPRSGLFVHNRAPGAEPTDLDPAWSCALDVADRGAHDREPIAHALAVVPERIRQIHVASVAKLREVGGEELRAIFDAFEGDTTTPRAEPIEAGGEGGAIGQRWGDDPHSWRRGDSIHRGIEQAEIAAEADAWADRVVAYLAVGVPLRKAWLLADDVDPSEADAEADEDGAGAAPYVARSDEDEGAPPAPGEVEREGSAPPLEDAPAPNAGELPGVHKRTESVRMSAPALPAPADDVAALVARRRAVDAKLRARLEELRAEVAMIERALGPQEVAKLAGVLRRAEAARQRTRRGEAR